MCPSRLLAAALLVAAGLTTANAADLSKIDRTLDDEPAYATPAPKYCLLAFGPEAKTIVWLIRDGDAMHVHASPDGKAPKAWRQVKGSYNSFSLGDVWEEGGLICHKNLRYRRTTRFDRLMVSVGGKLQTASEDRTGNLEFGPSAKEAPVVHFNGPLTLDLYFDQQPLIGGQTADVTAVVGTPGVGPGTFALFYTDAYPKNAWPTAVIEFPAPEGGQPAVLKVRLAEE